jgi:uncharacterized protein YqgC (DUF456 family)
MNTALVILAVIAGVIGIIGSIVPALPGPPISWLGILLMYFCGGTNSEGQTMSLTILLVLLGVTIAVTVIDYIVPIYFTRLTGGSKYAGWGATIGLLVGMFIPPIGIILGTLLGAFIAELIFAGKSVGGSIKAAFGSFLGFLLGTGIKLIASCVMFYYILIYI